MGQNAHYLRFDFLPLALKPGAAKRSWILAFLAS